MPTISDCVVPMQHHSVAIRMNSIHVSVVDLVAVEAVAMMHCCVVTHWSVATEC